MSTPVVVIRNLTKSYRLYAEPSDRLKEALWPWKPRHQLFHALQDVNFEVYRGEYVGIIGVNGAGKSTLLQIITGVLTPSQGQVDVNGSIAALLELGAGFNPDLTGRENAIFQFELAGIPRKKIDTKIAEVESFADIGVFFDQPMKIYSSGMYARVAFAASALVEPDILIADEILSVGDLKFQAKCADKMEQLRKMGCTVLFVSHSMSAVTSLCTKTLYLKSGKVFMYGDPAEVANVYYKDQASKNTNSASASFGEYANVHVASSDDLRFDVSQKEIDDCINTPPVFGTGQARIVKHLLRDKSGFIVSELVPDTEYILSICVYPVENVSYWHASIYFRNSKGIILFGTGTRHLKYNMPKLKQAIPVTLHFYLKLYFVNEPILLSMAIGDSAEVAYDSLQDVMSFECKVKQQMFGHIYGFADVCIDI